jgi:hypothetical protein
MVIGVLLILLGALGPIAALLWRSGIWLEGARWIARNSSLHVLYATPVAGVFLAFLGLSVIWPPAIVLVFLAAGAFTWTLLASPQSRRTQEAQRPLRGEHEGREARTAGPVSSRSDIARGTDRPGAGRRPQPRRSRQGPAAARRDVRRAG